MKFEEEIKEQKELIDFLERTYRVKRIDQYQRTKNCIHVLEDFSAIATMDNEETIEHLHKINRDYKDFREHALDCSRCQISLDNIFLFKGYTNRKLFPEKIRKILKSEWEYDKDKKIFIGKLPAPSTGNFGSGKSRLVYFTNSPMIEGIEEFYQRVANPSNLQGLTKPTIRNKKSSKGRGYFQADIHNKNPNYHTQISIRSRKK